LALRTVLVNYNTISDVKHFLELSRLVKKGAIFHLKMFTLHRPEILGITVRRELNLYQPSLSQGTRKRVGHRGSGVAGEIVRSEHLCPGEQML